MRDRGGKRHGICKGPETEDSFSSRDAYFN